MVFKKLIAQSRGKELMDTLEFLSARLYCRLAPSYDAIIRKLEVPQLPHAHCCSTSRTSMQTCTSHQPTSGMRRGRCP